MPEKHKYHICLNEKNLLGEVPGIKQQIITANEKFALFEMALVISGAIKGIVANQDELSLTGNTVGDVWLVRNPSPGEYFHWGGTEWETFETWMTADALIPETIEELNEITEITDLNDVPLPMGIVGSSPILVQEVQI